MKSYINNVAKGTHSTWILSLNIVSSQMGSGLLGRIADSYLGYIKGKPRFLFGPRWLRITFKGTEANWKGFPLVKEETIWISKWQINVKYIKIYEYVMILPCQNSSKMKQLNQHNLTAKIIRWNMWRKFKLDESVWQHLDTLISFILIWDNLIVFASWWEALGSI